MNRVRIAAAAFVAFTIPGITLAASDPAPRVLTDAAPRVLTGQGGLTIKDAKPDQSGIHRMVILRGLNKTTGRAIDISAPVGYPVSFGTLTITAFYCHTVPPEEPPETSAFLQVDDTPPNGKPNRIFSGWMFASSPALHPLEHAVYDVWVLTCKTDEPPPQSATAAPGPTPPATGKTPPAPSAQTPAAQTPPAPRAAAPNPNATPQTVPPRPASRAPTDATTP